MSPWPFSVIRCRIRPWFVVLGGFMCYMLADGCTNSIGILYSEFLDVFSQTKASTATLPGLIYAIPQLLGPLVCPFVDTVGCAVGAFCGAALLFFSFFISSFVSEWYAMYITLGVLASIGLELTYVSGIIAVTTEFTGKPRQGLATGITVSGAGIGVFGFNSLIAYLINIYAWRGTLLLEAAIFLHVGLAAAIFTATMRAPSLGSRAGDREQLQKPTVPLSATKVNEILISPSANIVITGESGTSVWRSHRAATLDRMESQEQKSPPTSALRRQFSSESNMLGGLHSALESATPIAHTAWVSRSIEDQLSERTNIGTLARGPRTGTLLSTTQARHCQPFRMSNPTAHRSATLEQPNRSTDGARIPVNERSDHLMKRVSGFVSAASSSGMIQKANSRPVTRGESDPALNDPSVRSSSSSSSPSPRGHTSDIIKPAAALALGNTEKSSGAEVQWTELEEGGRSPDSFRLGRLTLRHSERSQKQSSAGTNREKPVNTLCLRLAESLRGLVSPALWRCPTLLLFCLTNALAATAFTVPLTFTFDKATMAGVEFADAALLVSLIGAGAIIGQICFGFAADYAPPLLLYSAGCVASGCFILGMAQTSAYGSVAVLCVAMGITNAVGYALFPIIIQDAVGACNLAPAMGLFLAVGGVVTLCGTPLAGYMFDTTNSYTLSYQVSGSIMLAVPLCLSPVAVMTLCRRWRRSVA